MGSFRWRVGPLGIFALYSLVGPQAPQGVGRIGLLLKETPSVRFGGL
jgi:hypothetical protein